MDPLELHADQLICRIPSRSVGSSGVSHDEGCLVVPPYQGRLRPGYRTGVLCEEREILFLPQHATADMMYWPRVQPCTAWWPSSKFSRSRSRSQVQLQSWPAGGMMHDIAEPRVTVTRLSRPHLRRRSDRLSCFPPFERKCNLYLSWSVRGLRRCSKEVPTS